MSLTHALQSETENLILSLPGKYDGVEICIAQPGVVTILTTWARAALASVFSVLNIFTRAIPNVTREDLAAAVLGQVLHGFDKEMLSNADLVRLGREA